MRIECEYREVCPRKMRIFLLVILRVSKDLEVSRWLGVVFRFFTSLRCVQNDGLQIRTVIRRFGLYCICSLSILY